MSSKGTTARSSQPGGDSSRFYNRRGIRRHQQRVSQNMQRKLQVRAAVVPEASATSATVGESSSELALPSNVTNLDRLMESVTPFVQAKYCTEVNPTGLRTREADSHPFFYLEDLWQSFDEWSVYGVGVPLLLNGKHSIEQYYVPFLSGIELYVDPSKSSSQITVPNEEHDAESNRSTRVEPMFRFFEHEPPHFRRPLADKISELASKCPDLCKWRSCDLLASSWICVAWYPVYRIPVGPTLQDLDASFLTFHALSTQSRGDFPPKLHAANTRKVRGILDAAPKISLPVFALASYKLKGSIVSPCGPYESEQENALLNAADNWLQRLKVALPDFHFFRSHYHRWR